jgi:stage II sporulation protein D
VDWRGKVLVVLCACFFVLVIVPTAMANMVHRRDTDPARAWIQSDDAGVQVKVYDVQTGHVNNVALNDYLVGVLAAEMNPHSPMQALEAAAVAARTYVVHAMSANVGSHPTFANQHGADVTDNASLDLPWWSMAVQEQRFGKDLSVNTVRLQHAVLATDGLILTYNKQPILAFTFGESTGQTRDGSKVFGKPLPYLKSVACPDDAHQLAKSPIHISAPTLQQALQIQSNNVQLNQFRIAMRDAQGYVKAVAYHDKSWTGDDFASVLGLPSSNFTWTVSGNELLVQCKGVGTGIGMSLNEAKALAQQGKAWAEIVQYFYPGTQVEGDERFTQPATTEE